MADIPYKSLVVGEEVRVQGLVSRTDLNGRHGRVILEETETNRYGVQLDCGTQVLVKCVNLQRYFVCMYVCDGPDLGWYAKKITFEDEGSCTGFFNKLEEIKVTYDGFRHLETNSPEYLSKVTEMLNGPVPQLIGRWGVARVPGDFRRMLLDVQTKTGRKNIIDFGNDVGADDGYGCMNEPCNIMKQYALHPRAPMPPPMLA